MTNDQAFYLVMGLWLGMMVAGIVMSLVPGAC